MLTKEQIEALRDNATPGRRVQFHGFYCKEAEGTPFTEWDTSHEMSVIRPDGSRYRLARYKHASDAYLSQMAPDLADTALDALARLADAQAAQALVVERAAAAAYRVCAETRHVTLGRQAEDAIRALADTDGLALVQALRDRAEKAEAQRDSRAEQVETITAHRNEIAADRDRLAAQLAEVQADARREGGE